jgi:hypothetical protein
MPKDDFDLIDRLLLLSLRIKSASRILSPGDRGADPHRQYGTARRNAALPCSSGSVEDKNYRGECEGGWLWPWAGFSRVILVRYCGSIRLFQARQ